MKKILLSGLMSMLLCNVAFAGEKEDKKVLELLKGAFPQEIKIIEKLEIKGFPFEFIVLEESSNKQRFPIYGSKEGTVVMPFTPKVIMEDPKVFDPILAKLEELTKYNQPIIEKLQKEMENKTLENDPNAEKNKTLYKTIVDNLTTDVILSLGENPKLKDVLVVIDPECPFCREELATLEEKTNEYNYKFVFAPVHKKPSFIKSKLIMDQWKGAKTVKDKLAIMNKYFAQNYTLTEEELKTDVTVIEKNVKVIFSTGIVKGVPYKFIIAK